MINKNRFSQLAKRITRADHGLSDPQLIHPSREWKTGLAVAFVMFVASAIWSIQTYITFREVSAQEISPVGVDVVVYRESLVEAVLTMYEERQQAHEKFLNSVQMEQPIVPEGEGENGSTEEPQANSDDETEIVPDTTSQQEEEVARKATSTDEVSSVEESSTP